MRRSGGNRQLQENRGRIVGIDAQAHLGAPDGFTVTAGNCSVSARTIAVVLCPVPLLAVAADLLLCGVHLDQPNHPWALQAGSDLIGQSADTRTIDLVVRVAEVGQIAESVEPVDPGAVVIKGRNVP